VVAGLDESADRLITELTGEPAWPTLRAHLVLLAAAGADLVCELLATAAQRELNSARDHAAVIGSRIEDLGVPAAGGAVAVAAGHSRPHPHRPPHGSAYETTGQ